VIGPPAKGVVLPWAMGINPPGHGTPCANANRQNRPAQRQRRTVGGGHDADPRPLQRAGLRLDGRRP